MSPLALRVSAAAGDFMDGSPRSERVLEALRSVDRSPFLPESSRHLLHEDASIAVGFDQTSSQPGTLAFMFDKLGIFPGARILEIGGGTGYAAALASTLAAPGGQVHTLEIIPDLADRAAENLRAFPSVTVHAADGSLGLPALAPFDRIFLSAGTGSAFDPGPLLAQLAPGGRLMFPRRLGELFLYTLDTAGGEFHEDIFYAVSFVRMQGVNSGW